MPQHATDAPAGRLAEFVIPSAVSLLLAFTALVFLGSSFDPFEPAKTAVIRIACIAFTTLWLGSIVISKKLVWRASPADTPALLFFCWCCVSVLFAPHTYAALEELTKLACGLIMFFTMTQWTRSSRQAKTALYGAAAAAVFVAILGLLELLHKDVFPWDRLIANRFFSVFSSFDNFGRMSAAWSNDFDGRISSSIGNPVYAAGYAVLLLPPFIALAIVSHARDRAKSAIAFAGAAAAIFILVASFTRSSWAAAAAGIALFLITSRRTAAKKAVASSMRGLLPLALFALVLIAIFSYRNPVNTSRFSVAKRVTEFSPSRDDSYLQRTMIWKTTLEIIKSHPLRGVGIGQFTAAYPYYQTELLKDEKWRPHLSFPNRAHNDLLEVTAETGAVGLALFLLLLLGVVRRGFSRGAGSDEDASDKDVLRAGLVSGIAAMLLYSNFQFPLHVEASAAHFWIFCGLLAALDSSALGGDEKTIFDATRGARIGAAAQTPIIIIFTLLLGMIFLSLSRIAIAPLRANLLFERGLRVEAAGSAPDTALKLMTSGYAAYPHDTEICGLMASNLFRRSREAAGPKSKQMYVEKAMTILRQCMQMSPLDCRLLNMLGRHRIESGDSAEAVAAYEKSVNINPLSHESFYNLGIAYSLNGRYNDAVKALQRSIRLNPGFVPAYLNLGNAFKKLGREDAALSTYGKALEIDGGSPMIHATIGALLTDRGSYAEAEKHFRAALKAAPGQPDATGNMAILLSKTGRAEEAKNLLLQVLGGPGGANPRTAFIALYHLGDMYEKEGRRSDAVSAWRRANDIAPDSPMIRERLSEVSQ